MIYLCRKDRFAMPFNQIAPQGNACTVAGSSETEDGFLTSHEFIRSDD